MGQDAGEDTNTVRDFEVKQYYAIAPARHRWYYVDPWHSSGEKELRASPQEHWISSGRFGKSAACLKNSFPSLTAIRS